MIMRNTRIVCFHQGAELYGSDFIFKTVLKALSERNGLSVYLSGDGPLRTALIDDAKIDNVRFVDMAVMRRKSLSLFGFPRWIFSFICSVANVIKIIVREKPDIIYSNTIGVLSPLVAACICGKRRVSHVHEIILTPRFLSTLIYTLNYIFSNTVICVSNAVRDNYIRSVPSLVKSLFRRDVLVIRNGIPDIGESTRRLEVAPKKKLTVILVGRIHFWKGQDFLIDAVADLLERQPFLRDMIIVELVGDVFPGYESLKCQLQERVAQKGLNDVFAFLGYRTDAKSLMSKADIVVVPSTLPDPFPTVILEAMSLARPVIATKEGGASEMIVNAISGVLIESGNVRMFAEVLQTLLQDEVLRSNMGENARNRYVTEFSLEAFQKQICETFEVCTDG